jgi:hypothetical protein
VIVTFYDSKTAKGSAAAEADERNNRSGADRGVAQQCPGQGLQLHPDALEPAYPVPGVPKIGVEQ